MVEITSKRSMVTLTWGLAREQNLEPQRDQRLAKVLDGQFNLPSLATT